MDLADRAVQSADRAVQSAYFMSHFKDLFLIIFYTSAVLSHGWAKASACCFQVCLSCAVLCQVVSFQYSSKLSLHRFADLPRNLFLPNGLQMVMCFVLLSSLSRLMCPAQDHFILLVVFITSVTPVFGLTQVFVFLSWYVILSILLSIFVCTASSFFSTCFVSDHVSAPYVIAGSTHELQTFLFRQMGKLLLKMF